MKNQVVALTDEAVQKIERLLSAGALVPSTGDNRARLDHDNIWLNHSVRPE